MLLLYNDYLQTPVHLAYLYGQIEITQYLIKHGADVYAVDKHGCRPYK